MRLSSGAVTARFKDLGFSRLELEHLNFRKRGERFYRLRYSHLGQGDDTVC